MTSSLFRLSLGALLASSALVGVPVWAQQQPPATVLARVVAIAPQMQQVPVQVCNPAAAAPTGGGAALGAVAGGAIGSQFGSGAGHIAGAILGAIGGAVTGNAIEAQNRAVMGAGCGVQYQNRVTGYDVQYEWNGQRYHTQMATDPGQWVQITPPVGDGSYTEPGYADDGYDGGYANTAPPPQPPGAPAVPPPPVAIGTQVAPPGYYGNAYPTYPQPPVQPGYPAPVYAQPVYPAGVYPAPVVVRPAPVYVAPSVGISFGAGGGWRRGGWGFGVGF